MDQAAHCTVQYTPVQLEPSRPYTGLLSPSNPLVPGLSVPDSPGTWSRYFGYPGSIVRLPTLNLHLHPAPDILVKRLAVKAIFMATPPSHRPLRALLPADTEGAGGERGALSSSSSSLGPRPTSVELAPRRRTARAACIECRKRKTKARNRRHERGLFWCECSLTCA